MKKPQSLISFVEDRKGHDFRYAMDISRIKNELNWSPSFSFESGLEKTVTWYINNLDWVNSCVNLESF
jgi:dTDP-glucose 4,6-dehydratase